MATVKNLPPALEAGSIGAADQNESTPLVQRDPQGNLPQTAGPVVTDEGHYASAEYPVTTMVPDATGKLSAHTMTRRDR